MKRFLAYLHTQRRALLVWALTAAIFGAVIALYDLPLEPFGYAAALSAAILAAVLAAGWPAWARRCRELEQLAETPPGRDPALPEPEGGEAGLEAAYQQVLRGQAGQMVDRAVEARARRDDMLDYFTMWAHQVKTPLAAMRLLLQSGGEIPRADLERELFQTGRYVDMVLGYLRLGSETNDLVLAKTPLDPVVRQSLRRFARMFILKKLTLVYNGTDAAPVTDAKWVGFILEQLLSNAVKYTPAGGTVTVLADGRMLTVADTGAGIRPEDLPRIFEKGYPGCTGHAEPTSSGLGLYLCARAAKKLGCTIFAQSEPGHGAEVTLTFPPAGILYE